MAGKKAPYFTKEQVNSLQINGEKIYFLDTRESSEFNVSHLKDAIHIGYDNIAWDKLKTIDKSAKIIVYCSVGFRSGKVTEDLLKKGYTDVHNLYGGLFNWANNAGEIVDPSGQKTNRVHGYNKNWSKWINQKKCKVVL